MGLLSCGRSVLVLWYFVWWGGLLQGGEASRGGGREEEEEEEENVYSQLKLLTRRPRANAREMY